MIIPCDYNKFIQLNVNFLFSKSFTFLKANNNKIIFVEVFAVGGTVVKRI